MQGDARRYRAFISYSHRDEAVAADLHRRLERYRLPRRAGAADGTDRLTPIFRDLEELSAADNLSTVVEAALQRSDVLVVLCSPAAAASKWVAKEILRFRELHPGKPVLAALIAGTPAEAFPAPLTADGAEPLAADLTGGRSARQLGFLKLVAGIAGVALDALVQRDAQRRLRRVMVVTGASLFLVLIMAAMTAYAISARDEADRRRQEAQVQRAEAEGLVDFMLTDLRQRLRPVGRLDVLEAANDRALAYFGRQDLKQLTPKMLERRAAGLHNLAEDEITKKRWAPAQAAAAEAARTSAALLALAPDDPDRIFGHGQSVFWLAYIRFLQGDWDSAELGYIEYDRLARRLLVLAPGDVRSLEEAAYGAGNLCDVRMWAKRTQGLMPLCLRALSLMQRAADRQPGDLGVQMDVANRTAWAADAAFVLNDFVESRRLRLAQAALLDRLAGAHPDDRRINHNQAVVQRALAKIAARVGDRAMARRHIRLGIDRMSELVTLDPRNREWSDRLRDMKVEEERYR